VRWGASMLSFTGQAAGDHDRRAGDAVGAAEQQLQVRRDGPFPLRACGQGYGD
jgi:hypothetical protein